MGVVVRKSLHEGQFVNICFKCRYWFAHNRSKCLRSANLKSFYNDVNGCNGLIYGDHTSTGCYPRHRVATVSIGALFRQVIKWDRTLFRLDIKVGHKLEWIDIFWAGVELIHAIIVCSNKQISLVSDFYSTNQ